MRDTHRKRERQRHRQREKQAPCQEPNMGLDPGSPGSHLGREAAPNCWAIGAARFLTFCETSILFSRVAAIVFIPTNSVRESSFLCLLANTCCFLCC